MNSNGARRYPDGEPLERSAADERQGVRYIDCVDTARLVRRFLKEAYPDVEFTVHSHRDGAAALWPSLDVSWGGGPDEDTVRSLTDRFVGYTMECDEDLTPIPVPRHGLGPDGSETVHYGVMTVDLHRH